jgi:hypothetical protein
VSFRLKLFILPIIGLALFSGESYRSFHGQWRALKYEGACFCWAGLSLDTKPLNKSGPRNLTSCGYLNELNAYTDLGCAQSPLHTRLLEITALPAFIGSLGIVIGLARLGVNKVESFMVATPLLIFVWYYFVSFLIVSIMRRRKRRVLASH